MINISVFLSDKFSFSCKLIIEYDISCNQLLVRKNIQIIDMYKVCRIN